MSWYIHISSAEASVGASVLPSPRQLPDGALGIHVARLRCSCCAKHYHEGTLQRIGCVAFRCPLQRYGSLVIPQLLSQ